MKAAAVASQSDMMKLVFDSVWNIINKWENACNKHFLLYQQCFEKDSLQELYKLMIVW